MNSKKILYFPVVDSKKVVYLRAMETKKAAPPYEPDWWVVLGLTILIASASTTTWLAVQAWNYVTGS